MKKLSIFSFITFVCVTAVFIHIHDGNAAQKENPANWCRGGHFANYKPLRLAKAKVSKWSGTGRVYFYDDRKDCPKGKGCRRKEYIISGDRVLIVKSRHKGFVCAWYTSKKGTVTVGWLPSKNVQFLKTPRPELNHWVGTWKYADNHITIGVNKSRLDIDGNAFWKGSKDNIHIGEIDKRGVRPKGNRVKFSNDGCRVTMRLIGTYLVVKDNFKCGGVNVTFSGVYTFTSG